MHYYPHFINEKIEVNCSCIHSENTPNFKIFKLINLLFINSVSSLRNLFPIRRPKIYSSKFFFYKF